MPGLLKKCRYAIDFCSERPHVTEISSMIHSITTYSYCVFIYFSIKKAFGEKTRKLECIESCSNYDFLFQESKGYSCYKGSHENSECIQ